MSDDAQEAEVIEVLKKLTEQQEATLAILATVTARLDESEKRRQCLWLLNRIGQTMARLKVRSSVASSMVIDAMIPCRLMAPRMVMIFQRPPGVVSQMRSPPALRA